MMCAMGHTQQSKENPQYWDGEVGCSFKQGVCVGQTEKAKFEQRLEGSEGCGYSDVYRGRKFQELERASVNINTYK